MAGYQLDGEKVAVLAVVEQDQPVVLGRLELEEDVDAAVHLNWERTVIGRREEGRMQVLALNT